jgi:protein TonB
MQARDTVASIQADLDEDYRRFQNRPPHKYISARTRASHYAQYMDAWRQKVERIGELNFPDAARRAKLSGTLIMDLALNANGTINYVEIAESSGSSVLDDAAVRIARLGAPYLPFGKDIIEEIGENGILHIIRTWDFDTAGKLHSR